MNIDYEDTGSDIPDLTDAIQSRIVSNSEGPGSDDITGLQAVRIDYPSWRAFNSAILLRLRQLRGTRFGIRVFQDGKDIL